MSTSTIMIGTFEAKTKLCELLERIGTGATFTVTKRNKPVARFVDMEEEAAHRRIKATERLIELRKGCRLNGLKIKDLIEEGRR